VAGATVSFSLSGGASGSGSCTTGSNGQCSVTTGNLRNNVASVTFNVTNVAASGYSYDPGSNVISSVTVNRP
jgi:hypothetical protein